METKSLKQTYYQDNNFSVEYELAENILNLHCNVINFTTNVLRTMNYVFGKLMNEAREKGYEQLMTVTPNPRFAKLFAGKYQDTLVDDTGKEYEVYTWDLK